MSRKIKATYDGDPSAGNNPETNYIVAGDDNANNPVALDMDQLSAAVATRIGTSLPPTEDPSAFIVNIQENTLTANIDPITGITYTHYIINVDDAVAPDYPTGYVEGVVPPLKDVAAWGTTEVWRCYVYNLATGIRTEILPPNGISGVSVTPIATASAIFDSDISVAATTATTAVVVVPSASIVDDVDLTVDVVDQTVIDPGSPSGYKVLYADASAPTTVNVTGLTPSTAYGFMAVAYPTGAVPLGNRAGVSNIVTDSTISAGTVATFSLSPTLNELDPVIQTFSVTNGTGITIDEWLEVVGTVTPPDPNSSAWKTPLPTPTVTKITALADYGTYDVTMFVRDSNFPTSIIQGPTVSVTVDEDVVGDAIIQFATTTLTLNEEGSPTATITITRSNDTSTSPTVRIKAQTTGITKPALFDESVHGDFINCIDIDQIVSIPTPDTTVTVDFKAIWQNLGYDFRSLDLVLSDPVNGVLGNNTTLRINILGTYGYWSTGDIDIYNPPTNLERINARYDFSDASAETLEFKEIDLTDSPYVDAVNIKDAPTYQKTIQNCVIRGSRWTGISIAQSDKITIRNCWIDNCGRTVQDDDAYNVNYAVYYTEEILADQGTLEDLQVLNNRISGINKGVGFNRSRRCGGFKFNWNHKDTPLQTITSINNEFGINQVVQVVYSEACESYEVIGNSTNHDGLDTSTGFDLGNQDYFNVSSNGCASGYEGLFKHNSINGASRASADGGDSGGGILLGDAVTDGGYLKGRYNTVINSGNWGITTLSANGNVIEFNDLYQENGLPTTDNAVGIVAVRSSTDPGTFYDLTVQGNRIYWYKPGVGNQSLLTSDVGNDGLHPNHGDTPGEIPDDAILGWTDSQTNIDMSAWESNGENLVVNRKHILEQPGFSEGVYMMYANYLCPVGNGLLTYDDTGKTLTFVARGDASGTAKVISSTATSITGETGDERFELLSVGGGTLTVEADYSALNGGGDLEWPVKVTRYKTWERNMYCGTTGEWVGAGGTSPGGGTAPGVPTSVAAVPGTPPETVLDVTWTASSGSPTGYEVWIDGIYNKTVITNAAEITGLIEDVSVSVTVRAFDALNNYSGFSQAIAATPTGNNNKLVGGEFSTDVANTAAFLSAYTGWTNPDGLLDLTVSGGILSVRNTTPAVGQLLFTGTITSGKTHAIVINSQDVGTGSLVQIDIDSAAVAGNGLNDGDMLTLVGKSSPSGFDEGTWDPTNASTTTTVRCSLWTYTAVQGEGFDIDYVRLTENA